jgi:methylase of polypeptide subunit release factors
MKSFILALLLSSTIQGVKIDKVDLSPDAFAEASVNARILADQQIKEMNKKVSYNDNNDIWK